MTTLTLSRALNEGLRQAMEDDPKVLIMGEDVGKLGGVFRVTDGLQKDFGAKLAWLTPRWPSRASWAPRSAWPCAVTGRSARSSSTASSTPAFNQTWAQPAKMRMRSLGPGQPAGGDQDPVRRRHRRRRASQRVSRGAVSRTWPGCGVVACGDPADAYVDDPAVHQSAMTR